jgi:hypothetical protein
MAHNLFFPWRKLPMCAILLRNSISYPFVLKPSQTGSMVRNHLKKQVKKELESLGERAGTRVAHTLSKNASDKGGDIGKKLGKTLGEQVDRVSDALDRETVTREEELGIGGKIGTAVGIIGKHLVEKRYGVLGKLMGTADLVSDGRTTGAKAQKMVKRAIKSGVQRVAGAKRDVKEDNDKEP